MSSASPGCECHAHFGGNPLRCVAGESFPAFSIDADTGACSNLRRMLNAGSLPPADAIRTEGLNNSCRYDYPHPPDTATLFPITTEIGPSGCDPGATCWKNGIRG